MLLSLIKAIVLITSLNVPTWQDAVYKELVSKLTQPSFPRTTLLTNTSKNSASFFSYAAVPDPGNKHDFAMHDIVSMPTWLFLIRYDNRVNDELWHRGEHFNTPCNIVLPGNKILLHLKTAGFIKADVIFKVNYEIKDTKYGTILLADMDKSYVSSQVKDFNMVLWAFPHPTIKNLVIVVSHGYLKTDIDIDMLENHIKWHIDSVLQNFGERLKAITK